MDRADTRAMMRARTPEEASRRLAIVDDYLAIAAPTGDDDERFARDLGLTIDSLLRLSRARRLAAESLNAAIRPSARGDRRERRLAAMQAAEHPDLTRVSPARRPLVQRRLAAVRTYLALEEPMESDLEAGADETGLTAITFTRLVRCWTGSLDPAALPGASEPMRRTRRKTPTVQPGAEAHVARAISVLGTAASSLAIHREVVRLCRTDGSRPPSKSTVHARLARARAESEPPSAGSVAFAVDHVALSLAVIGPQGPQMPVLSFAFERSSGLIVGHGLRLDPPDAGVAAAVLARAARALAVNDAVAALTLGLPLGEEWDRLLAALTDAGVDASGRATRSLGPGVLAGPLFGDVIGTLRLRPRVTLRPASAPLDRVMGRDAPLTFDQAEAAVDDAIALHNRGRSAASAAFAPAAALPDLLVCLDSFAD